MNIDDTIWKYMKIDKKRWNVISNYGNQWNVNGDLNKMKNDKQ